MLQQCTIHVGKIDVFVKGKPDSNKTVSMRLFSVIPAPLTFQLQFQSVTEIIIRNRWYILPEPIIPASAIRAYRWRIVDAFTVRYLTRRHGRSVSSYYSPLARTYKTIELDKQIVFAELSDPFTDRNADTFGYESDVEQGRIRQCEVVWEVVYGKMSFTFRITAPTTYPSK